MHVYFDRAPYGSHCNLNELHNHELDIIYEEVCKERNKRLQVEANKNLDRERR